MGVKYITDQGPDGLCIGKSTSDKIAFHGSTPVDKAGSTEDLKDVLVALGLVTDSGATPLDLDGGALTAGATTFETDSTINDGVDFAVGTSSGTKIGTATTQKLGFFGATPVDKPGSTEDIKDALVSLGFIADSGATPLNLDSGAFSCGAATIGADSTLSDGVDLAVGTSTGTKIGTASTQKLSFWNATPVTRSTMGYTFATTASVSSGGYMFADSSQANDFINGVAEIKAMLVAYGLTA